MLDTRNRRTATRSKPPDEVADVQISWANGQFYATSLTHGRSGSGVTREAALQQLAAVLETALALEHVHPSAPRRSRSLTAPRWLTLATIAGRILQWRRLPRKVTLNVRTPD